jgi:hypothetical protein
MDKPIEGDPEAKAKADREKFESVKKVATQPVITKGSRGSRKLVVPELKSPDEKNPKWIRDPEEVMAERKAKAKAKRSKDEA